MEEIARTVGVHDVTLDKRTSCLGSLKLNACITKSLVKF